MDHRSERVTGDQIAAKLLVQFRVELRCTSAVAARLGASIGLGLAFAVLRFLLGRWLRRRWATLLLGHRNVGSLEM